MKKESTMDTLMRIRAELTTFADHTDLPDAEQAGFRHCLGGIMDVLDAEIHRAQERDSWER